MGVLYIMICVAIAMSRVNTQSHEMQCSSFQYERDTLRLVIKLEHTMGELQKQMVSWGEMIEATFKKYEQIEQERETRTEDMFNKFSAMQQETELKRKEMQSQIKDSHVDIERYLNESQTDIERQLKDSQVNIARQFNESQMDNDRQLSGFSSRLEVFQTEQTKRNQQVSFTAHGATGKLVNTVLTFSNVYLNLGGGYDQTTGRFTCPVAGTYLFSATLLSVNTRSSSTYCWIRKNRSSVVIVYSQEGSYDSVSVSALFHLSVGDLVDLGRCVNVNYIFTAGGWTSFTGSLIQAD